MKNTGKYDAHVFICTHTRTGPKTCCASKGSQELRDKLKKMISDSRVRVNNSGCLDRCEEGITAVIYPTGRWFTGLTKDSENFLYSEVQQILKDSEAKPE